MKNFYLLFTIYTAYSEKLIRNIHIPACRNCVHFIPNTYNNDFVTSYSKCNKFGNKDIITGEITNDFVDFCRKDESQCGKEGKYFEKEPNLDWKIWKHKFDSNLYNNIFTLSILLSIFATAYVNVKFK
jgi:hypothetical protein